MINLRRRTDCPSSRGPNLPRRRLHCASRQIWTANVRFGSNSAVSRIQQLFRYRPSSGNRAVALEGLRSAAYLLGADVATWGGVEEPTNAPMEDGTCQELAYSFHCPSTV